MNEERELNGRLVFGYILKHWRRVLIISLVCGVIGSAFYGVKIVRSLPAEKEQYEVDMENYENTKVSLTQRLSNTSTYLVNLNTYSQKSVKANIDPFNEFRTTQNISIVADNPEQEHQLTQAYLSFVADGLDYSSISASIGIDATYVEELISAEGSFDADTVTVTVIGTAATQTEQISDLIAKQITNETIKIKAEYGEHSLLNSACRTKNVSDSALLTSATGNILSINSVMNTTLTQINTLNSAVTSQQSSINNLSIPTNPSASILSKIVKNFLLSFFIGLIATIIILLIKVVNSNLVLSIEDLTDAYHIPSLGVFPIQKNVKSTKLDDVVYRLIDQSNSEDEETELKKVDVTLQKYGEGCKTILLLGNVDKNRLDDFVKKLQVSMKDFRLISSNNINANADELKKLEAADSIILVAERNVSRLNDVDEIVETVNNWKKPIIGSILL
jgi:hypothetical protein